MHRGEIHPPCDPVLVIGVVSPRKKWIGTIRVFHKIELPLFATFGLLLEFGSDGCRSHGLGNDVSHLAFGRGHNRSAPTEGDATELFIRSRVMLPELRHHLDKELTPGSNPEDRVKSENTDTEVGIQAQGGSVGSTILTELSGHQTLNICLRLFFHPCDGGIAVSFLIRCRDGRSETVWFGGSAVLLRAAQD